MWNADVLQGVYSADYGDPNETLRPIRIVGTRNGAFSGQVVIGRKQPIRGLTAKAGDLAQASGDKRISASAVQIRYGRPLRQRGQGGENVHIRYRGMTAERFDGLLEAPPAEIPVHRSPLVGSNEPGDSSIHGAVIPVWITVDVPADAAPGRYTGFLSVTADEMQPARVPIELEVCSWTLPDPKDYVTFVDFVPSPETTAMHYKMPRYSDAHFKLMERTFEQLARVGSKVLYLEMIARTNFGNSQSLVRWIRKPDGGYEYDFSVFDRYLEMGLKHLKPKYVVLYLSDFGTGSVNWSGEHAKREGLEYWDKVCVTELHPETRTVRKGWLTGPGYWDEKAAEAFWRPVLSEVRERLKKKGVLDNTLFGMVPEAFGCPAAGRVLGKLIPEVKGWANAGHNARPKGPAGKHLLCEHVYGQTPIPSRFGWDNTWDVVTFDRQAWSSKPLATNRLMAEKAFQRSERGFGRIGADFWPLPLAERHRESRGLASNRYPENIWIAREVTSGWLAPGPKGPISTIRFEMAREGVQECEARIFLERALYVDPNQRARLDEALVSRCRQVLSARTETIAQTDTAVEQSLWYPGTGWQQRSADLFKAAGDVSAELKK
jgi:hypothetical protein